jgi:hypothetical protein
LCEAGLREGAAGVGERPHDLLPRERAAVRRAGDRRRNASPGERRAPLLLHPGRGGRRSAPSRRTTRVCAAAWRRSSQRASSCRPDAAGMA